MEEELVFLNRFGELFVSIIRETLIRNDYPYAPGYDGSAYTSGRKGEYKGRNLTGVGNKVAGVGFGFQQNLYDSVDYEINQNQELEIVMNSYWRNVNFGREPGKFVPIKPLQYWAAFRLGLNDKEAKSMAFGISKNIQKFGIKPTYFMDIAIEEMLTRGVEELGEDFEEAISNIIDNKLFEKDIDFNKELTITL